MSNLSFNMKKNSSIILLLLFTTLTVNASDIFFPKQAVLLDNYFAHHFLIAEKGTHQIHLFANQDGHPQLIKSFQIATGKIIGDKKKEGDFKTPEGIYFFNEFLTKEQLLKKVGPVAKIYGAGAFVSNFPNEIDRIYGKKGTGIWLHSTNDETRIDKGLDSRGCVVMNNKDLIEVSKYIELNKTPFIITQDLSYLRQDAHDIQKQELLDFTNSWLSSWKQKDLNSFMDHYDQNLFIDTKGNFVKFKAYKKIIFSSTDKTEIEISHITILNEKDYIVIGFIQDYRSSLLSDVGKKELFIRRDTNGDWKIVRETWSKDGIDEHLKVAFVPESKFFDYKKIKQESKN